MKKEDSIDRTVRLGKKIRKVWTINPKTKVKGNDKTYNRKKSKEEFRKEVSEME